MAGATLAFFSLCLFPAMAAGKATFTDAWYLCLLRRNVPGWSTVAGKETFLRRKAALSYPGTAADVSGWGLIGHGLWTLGGGLMGGFVGEKTMEMSYDFLFTKGTSAK